jgi:hypothetical protein
MKGLAVGDLLLPTSLMIEVFKTDGLKQSVTEVVTTEFKRDRDEIRTAWRNVEEHGLRGNFLLTIWKPLSRMSTY